MKVLHLRRYRDTNKLTGDRLQDAAIVRQFLKHTLVSNEEEYNTLLVGVSEFGYCIETPADWAF